jgi:hypothetical protein
VLPVVLVIALGIASTSVMVAVVIALLRTLRVLSGSLARFRDDVQPVLEDVRKGTQASQEILERISSRQLQRGAGGRIRR